MKLRASSLVGLLGLVLSGLVTVVGTVPAASAAWAPPAFERTIGGSGLAGVYAWGLQYNPVTDEILVGDYFNFNIRRFDRAGNQLGSFGRPATERSGQPYSLAVDPRDGSVYVPEIGDGQPRGFIAKYDKDGNFLFQFNTGARYYAWIATDQQGNLYLADSHYWNNADDPPKIRTYSVNDATKSVTQVASFGTYGTGPGQMNTVRGIDVARNGNVFVADGGNNVVTEFTNSGQYVRTLTGPFGGDLRGISLDEEHNSLWVVDADGGNLEKFTLSTGAHVRSYGSTGNGPGQFGDGGRQLDVTPDGNVWVADYGNFRIQRFSATGQFINDYPDPATQPADGLLSKVRDVSVAPDGGVLVADTWSHRWQKFSATGEFVGVWGRRNSNPPYGMNYPRGIGVNPANGDVWVANTRSHTLRVYNSAMTYKFDVFDGVDSNRTDSARWTLDVDFGGTTAYVTDYVGDRVKAINAATGQELWSLSYNNPYGVAISTATDRMYVTGNAADRIDVYRLSNQAFLGSMGSRGTGPGQFQDPWDVEIIDTTLYVSDVTRNKVIAYSTAGAYLGEFGGAGNGPGQMRGPSGLSKDAQGRLYVADSSNYRVQVFNPALAATDNRTAPMLTIGSPGANATVPSGPVEITGTAVDPDGIGSVEVNIRDVVAGKVWVVTSSSWGTGGRWPIAALSGSNRTSMSWRWVFPAAQDGKRYKVSVRAYDAAGNLSPSPFVSTFFTVSNARPDTAAPTSTVTSPTPGETMLGRPVEVTGTASDDVSVAALKLSVQDRVSGLWWTESSGSWTTALNWNDAVLDVPESASTSWAYTFDTTGNPGSGQYWLAWRARDTSGKEEAQQGHRFDVYTGPQDAADPVLTWAVDDFQVFAGRPVPLTGRATDDVTVSRVQIRVQDRDTRLWWDRTNGTWGPVNWDEATLASPGSTASDFEWTFDDSGNRGSGAYLVQARVQDAVGNWSPVTRVRFAVS